MFNIIYKRLGEFVFKFCIKYNIVFFVISVFDILCLFVDMGIEVVFVGCFNVGKLSVFNMLID